jgi:hypothetical protein
MHQYLRTTTLCSLTLLACGCKPYAGQTPVKTTETFNQASKEAPPATGASPAISATSAALRPPEKAAESFNQVSKESPDVTVQAPAVAATTAALVPAGAALNMDQNFGKKLEIIKEYQDQTTAIASELDRVSERIEKSDTATQQDERPKLQQLRDQVTGVSQQLEKAKDATEATWTEVAAGLRASFADLQAGFTAAQKPLGEKSLH